MFLQAHRSPNPKSAGPSPAVSQDFLTNTAPPAWLDNSGTVGNRMMFDASGKLTFAPNNQLTFSNDFPNAAYTKLNVTAVNSADGTYGTVCTLTEAVDASAVAHGIQNNGGFSTQLGSFGLSIYAKAGTRSRIVLGFLASAGNIINTYAVYDLSTGTVINTAGGATIIGSGMVDAGNGWWRCYINRTNSASDQRLNVQIIRDTDTAPATYQSDGSGNVLLAWAQCDVCTYETTPRPYVGTTTSKYYGLRIEPGGVLIEESRTNVVLWNRELNNAAWVKTSITAAKNQTGLDGVTNSASSLTATAANGTCLQTITLASSQRFQTAYVKRITGTGVVEMTMDNGTTWTPITVTASWSRVSIPSQTLANPVVGFRIVTSGDAIAVDFVQNENGAFATSPVIQTSAATMTRVADIVRLSGASLPPIQDTAGSVLEEMRLFANTGAIQYGIFGNSVSPAYFTAALAVSATNGTNVLASGQTAVVGTPGRAGLAWGAGGRSISYSGSAAVSDVNGFGTIGPTVYVGSNNGSNSINGWVRSLSFYTQQLTNTQLASKTTVGGPL